MKLAPRIPHQPIALLLAAVASSQAFAWDNSAQIAQQQMDSARRSSEMARQQQLSSQRQADMLQANRLSQMRQDNQLSDMRQQELRKSAARVYGLDKTVTTQPVISRAAVDAAGLATEPNSANRSAANGARFPADSAWADEPSQSMVRFKPDGTFKLCFPKDGNIHWASGRYEVQGQTVSLISGKATEKFDWAAGSIPDGNGRPRANLKISNAQTALTLIACPACAALKLP
jgi:hypothetical protein